MALSIDVTPLAPLTRSTVRGSVADRLGRRALGLSMSLFAQLGHLAYRARRPFGGNLRHIDHVTLPCHDLAIAEAFYVGLLDARLHFRLDAAKLRRLGRPDHEHAGAVHLSLCFGSGTRLDLFQNEEGQPPRHAPHPHMAFYVAPRALRRWQARLEASGVPCYGPRRLGPPGQASVYFHDPFGNHLELVTFGFPDEIPVGYDAPPEMFAYEWRP